MLIGYIFQVALLLTVEMRPRDIVCPGAVIIIILILWGISTNPPYIKERARNIQDIFGAPKAAGISTTTSKTIPKCNLPRSCPINHFAFKITSGSANVVGPSICFEGQNVMSGVLNNIGPGLNIVLVNGENGKIEKFDYLNMVNGRSEDVIQYLKEIKPGRIVLVASYDDATAKMTDEIRDLFQGMGSTMIKSLKHRDSWVFAGGSGTDERSPFEKLVANDEKTNLYGAWPENVEMSGCFPRKM